MAQYYRHITYSDGSSAIQNPDGSHHSSYDSDELSHAKEVFHNLSKGNSTSSALDILGADKDGEE